MGKFLNVKELIEVLQKYDGDLIPVILRDGNGHYAAIEKKYIKKESSVYFPDDTDSDLPEKTKFLRIGII